MVLFIDNSMGFCVLLSPFFIVTRAADMSARFLVPVITPILINSGLGRAASHASSAWGNWFCPLAKIGSSFPLAYRFQILWVIVPLYLIDVTYAFPWNLVLSSHRRQKWAKRFLWRTLTHDSNTDN